MSTVWLLTIIQSNWKSRLFPIVRIAAENEKLLQILYLLLNYIMLYVNYYYFWYEESEFAA